MNAILLLVATMTWVYVGGVGRSSGLMSSSVIGLSVLIRCDGGHAGRSLPEAEHGAGQPGEGGACPCGAGRTFIPPAEWPLTRRSTPVATFTPGPASGPGRAGGGFGRGFRA